MQSTRRDIPVPVPSSPVTSAAPVSSAASVPSGASTSGRRAQRTGPAATGEATAVTRAGTASTPAVGVPGLVRLVEGLRDAAAAVSGALAEDPSLLAELSDELLESFRLELHAARDAADAAATVVTGRLDRRVGSVRGKLVAGRYPSTTRFLEREAGLSPAQARAAVARGRDLDTHSTQVADSWLAGRITGGAVRELTLGVTDLLRRCARTDTRLARAQALAALLPVAEAGDSAALARRLVELRLTLDPDGATEDALFAFERQSLSIVAAGSMYRLRGDLTPEVAAAASTVLEQVAGRIATEQLGVLEHDADCETAARPQSGCTCGELDRARRAAGLQRDQLLARAFGEVMTDQLDRGGLGTHHGVAPHLTVVADLADVAGTDHPGSATPLLGRLAVPGSDDDALLPAATLHRMLCDAEITRVLTARGPVDTSSDATGGPLRAVARDLAAVAREVLYVGRAQRTVPPRLRRALEARDGHCVFPGCRAHARRCHAHHVLPWEHGGATDLPNLALLCVAHHHAVHEGGWAMALRALSGGHDRGCWEFTPPSLHRRRLRP
ncbi:MAG: DUF222 domain-containing protein [Frankiales bacterium]|nr:DUF222 domain-containing protein [Frankiales bacterium]